MQLAVLLCLTCPCIKALPMRRVEGDAGTAGAPMPPDVQQVALQEDVNLLVYGVLQFSQALHDIYRTTGRKIQRVDSSLDIYNLTLGMLARETQEARRTGEQLKGTVRGLQMEEKLIQSRSTDIRRAFSEVLEGQLDLELHVRKLEQSLNEQGGQYLSRLKTQTQQQNLTLRTLMDMVQHQQRQMIQQRQQLSQIQDQIENRQTSQLSSHNQPAFLAS